MSKSRNRKSETKVYQPSKKIVEQANVQEYESMADYYQMDVSPLLQRFKINEFLITAGSKGGSVREITGKEIRYKAAATRTDGDPTGAGDIFLAAYVSRRMLNHESIPHACKYAARLAARQIDGNYIKPECLTPEHLNGFNET